MPKESVTLQNSVHNFKISTKHFSDFLISNLISVVWNHLKPSWDLLTDYELAFERYQFPEIRLSSWQITEL